MPTPIGGGLASDPEPKFRTQAETFGKGTDHTGNRAGQFRGPPRPTAPQCQQGVHFPIYRAPTAQFRIFSSVLPYSVLGCNNSQFGQRLQPSTLYGRTLLNIRNCAVGARYIGKWTPLLALGRSRPGRALELPRPVPRVVGALPKGLSLGPELGFWVRCWSTSDRRGHKLVIMFIFLYEQLYLSILTHWYRGSTRYSIFGTDR